MNMLRFNGFKCLLVLSILCYLTHPVLSDCRDATFDVNFDYFPDKVYFDNDIGTSNSGFNPAVAAATNYIQVPVTNVVVSDRSFISFLEILGEEKTSLKYVDDKKTITSPCLQKYNYLYDNFNYANTSLVSSVDVIFTNKPSNTGGKYVTISYDEDTPALQKAEWIKYMSLFFNKTAIANEAFDKIRSNYFCHLDNLSKVPNETKKSIAWVSLESDKTFTIKSSSFYPNVTSDAAAFLLNPQITTDLSVDDLKQYISGAYIVIDMSDLITQYSTLDAWKNLFGYNQTSDLPRFLKEKLLFRTHKLLNSNGNDDWSESSASRPDLILQDLIAIQYPSYQKDYVVNWFNKFAETGDEVVISADKCNDATFGLPKTDFGTCVPTKFLGDGRNNSGIQIMDVGRNEVSLVGSLLLLGLGAVLLAVSRRKYRERFVKLRDEPVVQMDSVKEVKEVKV
ncbi:unnamed protein product [Rhizophagus irregularis]|uniref:Periplasmic binding protein n=1 Tax=Rhizophagus irregularis TaxID=588596 RepID=A0A916DZL5_9GLOM|nr:unnamed protein product [Rhizophagus irregularis]CAB5340254.1 unnamed protein product [Rhizophagus irregularis]